MEACLELVKIKTIFEQANLHKITKFFLKFLLKLIIKILFFFQLSTQFELRNLMDIGLYLHLCSYKKFSMQGLVAFWTGEVLGT